MMRISCVLAVQGECVRRRDKSEKMLRLSVRWVDRLPINRTVGIGKPGHVVCAADPRVTREAEKGRCPQTAQP